MLEICSQAAPSRGRFVLVPEVTRLFARAWIEREMLLARMRALVKAMPALDLRIARALAVVRRHDLSVLGYPGWLAFTREHVEWGEAWIRTLLRLVRSGLEEVIRAACEGQISLSVAVLAPGTCAPDAQAAWIAAARLGSVPRKVRKPSGSSSLVEVGEREAGEVWRARARVKVLEGLPLSDREADQRLLEWWRAAKPREDIVAAALAPAPTPSVARGDESAGMGWNFADPAEALLGPWRPTGGLEDGLVALHAAQAGRRARCIELGRLYERVVREGIYRSLGFGDIESFCQETLGVSARTLQRHRELGRSLRRFPALEAAARGGLSLARVQAVARIATRESIERWIAVAERTPVAEIEQAARHVETGADAALVLAAYEEVMATTTGNVALAAIQMPVPAPLTDRVHPDLPAAARWLLSVAIPPQRGFGKVKERASFRCGNPECRRAALRNHAHHLRQRQHGGDDTLENGICVCPSCHLRLIHANIVVIQRVSGNVQWSFPGRTVTVAPGPDL